MSITTAHPTPRRTARWRLRAGVVARSPVLWAVLVSRFLVLLGGLVGQLAVPRVAGWQPFDPLRVSSHLGGLGNVLAATSVRWDSLHYLEIAQHGYATASDTVFFPLYPALTAAAGLVCGSDVWGGMLVSAIALAAALLLLHRLTELELGRRAADIAVALLALAPLSFFFTAIYTESLFLALSVGAVYAARRERWAVACGLAALATLTRVPGILVLAPVGWLLLRSRSRSWARAALLVLPPLALAGFLAYLHGRGFGWTAPLSNQEGAVHAHQLTGPFIALGFAVAAALRGVRAVLHGQPIYSPSMGTLSPFSIGVESILLLLVLLLAIALLVVVFRRLRPAYAWYALLTLAVCISSPVAFQPLQSLDRYTLTIFPLWMAAGGILAGRPSRWLVLAFGAALLFFYSFEFATWVFIA